MKKYTISLILLVFQFVGLSMAQIQTFTREPFASMITDDDLSKLERQFEIPIRTALGDYFPKESFLVDVKINLKEVFVPIETKRTYTAAEAKGQVDVQVDGLDAMPGLPFVPEEYGNRTTSVRDSLSGRGTKFKKVHEISTILVNVVLDDSYGQNDVDFVSALIRSVGKLNQFRGDQIIIESRKFPNSKKNKAGSGPNGEFNAADSAAIAAAMMSSESQSEKSNAQTSVNERNSDSQSRVSRTDSVIISRIEKGAGNSAGDQLNEWFTSPVILILMGFMLVNLLLLVYLLATRNQKTKVEMPEIDLSSITKSLEEIKNQKVEEKVVEQVEEVPTVESQMRYESDKSYLTIQVISNSEAVGEVLVEMIESDVDNGALKAANSILSVNPGLLSSLKPIIGEENHHIIEQLLEDLPSLPEAARYKFARSFAYQVKAQLGGANLNGHYGDIFNFMDQLTDSQLMHLFKNEQIDMIAIAMAQLHPERANKSLRTFEEEEQMAILVKMGRIGTLPISTYKQIATHFAQKALEIVNMKFVVADGVQRVIDVIDNLPAEDQDVYLDKIAMSDLDLATKVRSMFVTFSDIPSLDDSLLIKSLSGIDRKVIVLAMFGAEAEIVDKMMSIYASRERMIVRSQIDSLSDPEPELVEDARKDVLAAIRSNNRKKKGM
jgi:flagellar motor switch protein FliG